MAHCFTVSFALPIYLLCDLQIWPPTCSRIVLRPSVQRCMNHPIVVFTSTLFAQVLSSSVRPSPCDFPLCLPASTWFFVRPTPRERVGREVLKPRRFVSHPTPQPRPHKCQNRNFAPRRSSSISFRRLHTNVKSCNTVVPGHRHHRRRLLHLLLAQVVHALFFLSIFIYLSTV